MKHIRYTLMIFLILMLSDFCSSEIRQEQKEKQEEDYSSKCPWPADCRKIREENGK